MKGGWAFLAVCAAEALAALFWSATAGLSYLAGSWLLAAGGFLVSMLLFALATAAAECAGDEDVPHPALADLVSAARALARQVERGVPPNGSLARLCRAVGELERGTAGPDRAP